MAGRVLKVKVKVMDQDGPTSIEDSFYRASSSSRGICHGRVSVCLSVCVCLSQVGVLLKWLNVGTRKQRHTIAQGL